MLEKARLPRLRPPCPPAGRRRSLSRRLLHLRNLLALRTYSVTRLGSFFALPTFASTIARGEEVTKQAFLVSARQHTDFGSHALICPSYGHPCC